MDLKLIFSALFVLLAGLVYNSLANDSEVDSIDSLIKRLEHVLEIQARSEHELDDITDDIGEDGLESIDEELADVRKRWLGWNIGTYGGGTTKRKTPVRINSKRRLRGTKGK